MWPCGTSSRPGSMGCATDAGTPCNRLFPEQRPMVRIVPFIPLPLAATLLLRFTDCHVHRCSPSRFEVLRGRKGDAAEWHLNLRNSFMRLFFCIPPVASSSGRILLGA